MSVLGQSTALQLQVAGGDAETRDRKGGGFRSLTQQPSLTFTTVSDPV